MGILYLPALILAQLTISDCNMTEGFGRDVEATGDAIDETADRASDDDQ